jgi:autotransporter-associated beta strand protein
MPTFIKAYLGATPLFTSTATAGFASIEGTDAGGGVQSLANEFKHSAGTLTIFGNVTSTKDFHLCEGSSTAPANCVIAGTLTQTNAGPQGGPRGFTVAQSAGQVGTLTINGATISLFAGAMIGDNQSTGAVGAITLNSGTFAMNGGFWFSGPSNTFTMNNGTATMTNCYIGGGGNGTTNPNPVSVITINGGVFNISQPVAINQSNMIFGVSTAGISSTNTVNLNGGTLKHNHFSANTPASGRTQVNTINFNGGVLELDKGASRAFPLNTPVGVTWNLIVKNGGAVISVATGLTMTMAVAFSNDGSNGGLTKVGAGTLDMGSLAHSYNGTTAISAGIIRRAVTSGASTGTATFGASTLSVSFNVAPPSGTTTFKFFPAATTNSYASVTLTGVSAGTTATYNSANSTLSVIAP